MTESNTARTQQNVRELLKRAKSYLFDENEGRNWTAGTLAGGLAGGADGYHQTYCSLGAVRYVDQQRFDSDTRYQAEMFLQSYARSAHGNDVVVVNDRGGRDMARRMFEGAIAEYNRRFPEPAPEPTICPEAASIMEIANGDVS